MNIFENSLERGLEEKSTDLEFWWRQKWVRRLTDCVTSGDVGITLWDWSLVVAENEMGWSTSVLSSTYHKVLITTRTYGILLIWLITSESSRLTMVTAAWVRARVHATGPTPTRNKLSIICHKLRRHFENTGHLINMSIALRSRHDDTPYYHNWLSDLWVCHPLDGIQLLKLDSTF